MKLGHLYADLKVILEKSGVEEFSYEASLILSHVLKKSRAEILAHFDKEVADKDLKRILKIAKKRAKAVPMAYLLGYRDFYRDRVLVGPGTLIPRADTEHLIEAVQDLHFSPKNVLEIGVGSGALLLSLFRLFPNAFFTGLDLDLKDARKNLKEAILTGHITLFRRNVFYWKAKEKYDLVISNPPYLSRAEMKQLPKEVRKYEPHRALYGGRDGLKFYRFFARKGKEWLNPDGYMILEVDTKWKRVAEIFKENHFELLQVIRDYQNLERVMILRHD